jgi:hypothetical protein
MTNATDAIDDEPLPPELGAKFQTAFGMDEAPDTFGEWIDALAEGATDAGLEVDLEALCVAEDSGHVADVGEERYHFHCVLDTFLLPALLEEDRIEVTSTDPIDGDTVELTVTKEGVSASPADAVVSFGVHRDVEPPQGDAFDPEVAYARVCPYINAFPSQGAYERWDERVEEAVTVLEVSDDSDG